MRVHVDDQEFITPSCGRWRLACLALLSVIPIPYSPACVLRMVDCGLSALSVVGGEIGLWSVDLWTAGTRYRAY
jgi:hypothetical protein